MWITVQLTLHDVAGGECDQLGGENPPQRAGWDGDAAHRQVPTSHILQPPLRLACSL